MQDKLLAFAEFLPRGLNMTYLIDPNLTVIERSMTASISFYKKHSISFAKRKKELLARLFDKKVWIS
ncbi:hypothetical protein OUZ56_031275 [Daphnia magna]|uniref:Uncharacterized protein n=1 Tax=Daphnia magna TaxID=35525 RepID=A0ABQ9ZTS2_9CRUS|nr:hypothetical protein OUZ56_031275 [Daphnia magna]